MNEATNMVMTASSDIIMMEITAYFLVSVVILLLIDFYARKRIGSRESWDYKILKTPKAISTAIIVLFTIGIFAAALFGHLTVSRYTLTYFGLPYYISLLYFLVKTLRRVRSVTKRR